MNYTPYLSSASPAPAVATTLASNASTTFNSSKQTITLSATVTAGSANVNEGNETFTVLSGINIIGTPVTVPVTNGIASTSNFILPAGTSAGTYTIQATYYGTANYLGFIDASHTLAINTASTTTGAASATTTFSTVTQSVPLTATITSAAGTVSGGTVTFTILNGGTTVATATSSNNITSGIATATVMLPAGTAANAYTIQAVYSGTGNFGGSSDSSHVLTVSSTTTTTTVASSANPSVVGQFVTFAATVVASSPGLGTPTGSVTFMDGTSILGTAALSGGTALFTTPSLALNAHSITAVYAGNSSFAKSTSPPLSETVNQDATTALALSSVNPSASGQPVVFTAAIIPAAPGTGVPTGTVTFKDGGTVLATETLSGGVTSFVDTSLSNGVHSITAVYAGDPNFKASTSTVLAQLVGQNPATATFIKSDTNTGGSWINTYGTQGYDIVSGPVSLPSYATVTPAGQSTYTWTTTSTDSRALQVPGSANRVAAAWYSATSFTVDVNLSDGNTHNLELYMLDFDNKGRAEQVQNSDASSGTVLDTRTISSFSSGLYLDYAVSGNILIKITNSSNSNAVLNGLFLDPASTAPITPTITWANPASIVYGTALGATQLDATASVPGTFAYTPAANTVLAAGSGQKLSVTFTPTDTVDYTTATATVLINVSAATPTINWANPADIVVGTALSSTQLDATSSWTVGGVTASVPGSFVYTPAAGTILSAGKNQTLSVSFTPTDLTDYTSANASVVINVNAAAGATADFLEQDTTTAGSWINTYGTQGYDIVSGPVSLPSYATITPAGQSTYTWTTTSTDSRALQVPGSANRVAAAWYSATSFTVDVNLSDGNTHNLELYMLDFDNKGRAEQVQISDASSGTVLDTRTISSFSSGLYLDYAVSGNILIKITRTAGTNALLNGLFIDPATSDESVLASSSPAAADARANPVGSIGMGIGAFLTAVDGQGVTADTTTHDLALEQISESTRSRLKSRRQESHRTVRPHLSETAKLANLTTARLRARARVLARRHARATETD